MLRILNGCASVVYVACSGQTQAPRGAGETAPGRAVEETAGNITLHIPLGSMYLTLVAKTGIERWTYWSAQVFQVRHV
jgi:hypothetical protein